jgi:hypothetical protein
MDFRLMALQNEKKVVDTEDLEKSVEVARAGLFMCCIKAT